ncbi:HAD ATPase, P-type, family IC [Vittaforma corneae ATCC 50505]|uniref:HAD ATPase, P-type, family IC n=1 Tax=Vittaforma corneae (strain ATCC 50505) TaxID=993615 RepID=L2GP72_VITCO|nr:HAD ATPase, P-type, family IC [Vittaforma corneae ATCC 50505]ELA42315.1 HAD ATPase, P-type, family IC [Vittaforma corneae ATCC 50505]
MTADLKRYKSRNFFFHSYLIFLYMLGLLFIFKQTHKAMTIVLSFAFGLSFLATYWSTKILIFECFNSSEDGDYILFENRLNKVARERNGVESFFSNRKKYIIRKNKAISLSPVTELDFKDLRSGIKIENYDYFAPNEFKVPRPNFFTMFKEQCVTPLFCFQIFSSLLMCFDEHVMNSLFSTAMIIFVEASFVLSRVTTMKIFRKLEHKTCDTKRISRGNGTKIANEVVNSSVLKPGDKILIDSIVYVPCDLVIIEGSCAVNEAMLSGESIPLFKEEIIGSNSVLNIKEHRRHILFAGTKLEKIYSPLTCVVLRTSFDTEQGILLNKMLQSEDIKYDPEALRFILLLSLISIINCLFTFVYSKKTGYPLFLDIIILFTNTIPFELPMEMGMSVQSAVKNLMSKKIYCLEPFRITLAGKVDVCCFDKTGTLTDSRLEVKKIEFRNENTNRVLSCCHNLIVVDGEVKGDPLEIAICNYEFEKIPFKVHQQFAFSSELKRQCVVAELEGDKKKLFFCMKGAPEEVQKYLADVPKEYERYKEFASQGFRVLSLACRYFNINDMKLSNERLLDRSYLERDMEFCGFILLGSSLKKYSREMCKILKDSGLKVLMITGDNLLTAMNVAEQLNIQGEGVEGKDIEKALESDKFVRYAVFGRAEPKHKELIIKKYQSLGFHTMMVGDGTNDVGALKAADVGVAMLEPQEVVIPRAEKPLTLLEQVKAESATLESIKPGDASIAAPLTVKSDSLKSIVEIIQQGRSSLVTTIQMYKILAINSIISAFFYMFVDVLGVKFSDPQMISIGVLSSIGFTAITQPKALDFISKQRPITSIFSPYMFFSILSQSIVQVSSLYLVYKNISLPKPVVTFEPSVMNTVLFIISSIQTVSTLVCNYIGRPFREDLVENKMLGLSLLGIIGFIGNIFLNFHPDLNNLISVVNIDQHSTFVIGLCVSIVVLSYACERSAFRFFMIK